jgi:hypothetical protein
MKTLRPLSILKAYWQERILIEEQARFLDPVYFFEVEL